MTTSLFLFKKLKKRKKNPFPEKKMPLSPESEQILNQAIDLIFYLNITGEKYKADYEINDGILWLQQDKNRVLLKFAYQWFEFAINRF